MKYVYTFLLGLMSTPAVASIYATPEAAAEGITRGKPLDAKDNYVRGVGSLDIETDDPAVKAGAFINANAILVASDKILTCAHIFKKYNPTSVAAIFYPDIIEYNAHVRSVLEAGYSPAAVSFHGKSILEIAAKLDLSTIQYHPTLDLALVNLKRELPSVPRLPLLLEKPGAFSNGVLISYAETGILGKEEVDTPLEHQGKRHISILDIKEEDVPDSKGGVQTYWTKEWDVPAAVDAMNPRNKVFAPKATDHRLAAYSQPGDSGAPFVMKRGKDYLVSGVYKGKTILLRSGDTATATAAGEGAAAIAAGRTVLSLITPLYLAKDWLAARI